MSGRKSVMLTLSQSDRELILEHGYPFPKLRKELNSIRESRDDVAVPCERYELVQLLGDLARSINDCEDDDLQLLLDELYVGIASETGEF